jgi:hypothetical protein
MNNCRLKAMSVERSAEGIRCLGCTEEDAEGKCFACGGQVVENTWFARIKLGEHRVIFCRPRCVEIFLDSPAGFAPQVDGVPKLYLPEARKKCETIGNQWRADLFTQFKLAS